MRNQEPSIELAINRTPAPVELEVYHEKTELTVFGCELRHGMTVGRKPVAVQLHFTTPYMPITSDGKTPNLLPYTCIAHPDSADLRHLESVITHRLHVQE